MYAFESLEETAESLRNHPIYNSINDIRDLCKFMEFHIFCVWDFMSLVKSVQMGVCSNSLPWLPPKDGDLARMMNEIMVDEESDLGLNGKPISHFEMYLAGMEEVGADTTTILGFINRLRCGEPVAQALNSMPIHAAVKSFVEFTLSVCQMPLLVRAGVFFHSRECMIPQMFRNLVDGLQSAGTACPQMLYYLDRHIQLDEDNHGPMAKKIMENLYATSPEGKVKVEEVSQVALAMRINLWDACLRSFRWPKEEDSTFAEWPSHTH